MQVSTHQDSVCENTLSLCKNKNQEFSQEEIVVLEEGICGEWSGKQVPQNIGIKTKRRSFSNTSHQLKITPSIQKKQHGLDQEQLRTALNFPRYFIGSNQLHNQKDDQENLPLTYGEIISTQHRKCQKILKTQFEGTQILCKCGTWMGKDYRIVLCAECDRVCRFHFDSWLWKQNLNQQKLKTFMKICPKLRKLKENLAKAAIIIWKNPAEYLSFYSKENYKEDQFTQHPWERENYGEEDSE